MEQFFKFWQGVLPLCVIVHCQQFALNNNSTYTTEPILTKHHPYQLDKSISNLGLWVVIFNFI